MAGEFRGLKPLHVHPLHSQVWAWPGTVVWIQVIQFVGSATASEFLDLLGDQENGGFFWSKIGHDDLEGFFQS